MYFENSNINVFYNDRIYFEEKSGQVLQQESQLFHKNLSLVFGVVSNNGNIPILLRAHRIFVRIVTFKFQTDRFNTLRTA